METNFFYTIYRSLQERQKEQLLIWPDKNTPGGFLTYTGEDIQTQIATIRQELLHKGLKKGDSILMALPVSFNLICTLLAVMAIGAIPVLPPAGISLKSLAIIIHRNRIKAVITADKTPFHWLAFVFRIRLIPLFNLLKARLTELPPPEPVSPDQPALISHSSGSTGKPKAIYRSHRVLQAQHQALKEIFPPWPGQRDFPLFPNILLHNLSLGATSILPDVPWNNLIQLSPKRIVQQLTELQPQSLTGNVFYFKKLLAYLQLHKIELPNVLAVGIGGSPVPEPLAHALKKRFPMAQVYVIYGSSEAEPIAVRHVQHQEQPHKGYAVGPVCRFLEYRIDPINELHFPDKSSYPVGEICVRGKHVAASAADGWLHTGDYGYIDTDKKLHLTGRKGNEKVHFGFQHYQVEHVLLHVPGVERAAALSTEHGFKIFIEGTAKENTIKELLFEYFPPQIIQSINYKEYLPVDARHHSKILYANLR